MFLPRISIRLLFSILAIAGVYFFFLSLSLRGHSWAISIAATMTMVMAAFVLYSIGFAVAFVLAGAAHLVTPKKRSRAVEPRSMSIVEDDS